MNLLTERLAIRPFTQDDAAFILELVNDADWLRFIGDKNVHSLEDAQRYLRDGPLAMLAQHGVGLCRVERRSDGAALGMCGLIKRDTLEDIDLGFAFLPAARGQGFAREAAAAVLAFGFGSLGLKRIVAITAQDNAASARVLEAVGLRFERRLAPAGEAMPLRLFAADATGSTTGVGSPRSFGAGSSRRSRLPPDVAPRLRVALAAISLALMSLTSFASSASDAHPTPPAMESKAPASSPVAASAASAAANASAKRLRDRRIESCRRHPQTCVQSRPASQPASAPAITR